MRKELGLFLAMLLVVGSGASLAFAQDLAAGTEVLAQTNTDVKFYPATVVKKALDGYTVKFEDGSLQDVLQADLAYAQPPAPALLAVDTKVAALAYGDFYPGRIFELGEDGNYVVAWDGSGADPVSIDDIRVRMAPRSDPRPKPPAPPAPSQASAPPAPPQAPAPGGQGPAPSPKQPAGQAAQAPAAPPPAQAGGDDFGAALGGILGMAGDRYPMKYSLLSPAKSAALTAKTDLAEISLDIPADYVPVGLDFKIKNRSSKPLSIDWSKCYVTSFAGAKRAIYHLDYQTLEAMPTVEKPTELPAGAEQTFSLFAREGVVTTFHPAHWDGPKWIEQYTEILNIALFFGPDLPNALSHGYTDAEKAKDLELRRKNVVGKSFKVGIALVQGGVGSLVEFTVRVDSLDQAHEGSFLDSIGK